MEFILFLLWVFASLLIVSLIARLARKHGVEYITATVACLVVIANVLANKIILVGKFAVPAGIVVFSMTFFLTDVLCELWGRKHATRAVWAGFFANLILLVSLYIALGFKSPDFAAGSAGIFNQALKSTPRIIIASLAAYLISQHHDVWAFVFIKKLTKGKHLWLRNNLSTIISQLLDSAIFVTIAFYGVFPVLPLIFGQWIIKTMIALIDTIFIYWVVKKIKS